MTKKSKISLIVAYGKDRVIGKDNKLLWRLPNDLKKVKELTENNAILMGRKTYESLGKPLPNRINIVLTRDNTYKVEEGNVIVINDKEEIYELKEELDVDYIYIFGGEEIYKIYLNDVEEMRITEVEYRGEGDTYFPNFKEEDWKLVEEEEGQLDNRNNIKHTFKHYRRK